MDEIERCIEELKNAIKRSNEYTQYQILWEEISRKPELRDRLNQFRRERFYMDMGQQGDLAGKMNQITRDFEDILNQSLIKDFLAAEQRFSKKIRYIENSILEAVGLNVEFLD